MPKKTKSRRSAAQRRRSRTAPESRGPAVSSGDLAQRSSPAQPASDVDDDPVEGDAISRDELAGDQDAEAGVDGADGAGAAAPSRRRAVPADPAPSPARRDTATPAPRRVARVDPAQRRVSKYAARGSGAAAAAFEPLDPGDPAIPFDRAPYVPGDLRRVALMALTMVVLIVVAAFVVRSLVK